MTEFEVYPMSDAVPEYPHHSYVLEYFKKFSKKFDIEKSYRFNSRVSDIHKNGTGWKVQLDSGEVNRYDGVVIATGIFSKPNIPELAQKFSGEWIHSKNLKSFDILKGKRVLVVGGGNSGCDIAVESSRIADSVCLSVDKGNFFVPKYIKGKPYDMAAGKLSLPRFIKQRLDAFVLNTLVGDTTRFGFPKPKHKIYELHPVVNTQVLYQIGHGHIEVCQKIVDIKEKRVFFNDGREKEFDLIIFATGFQLNFPFVDKKYLNWKRYAPDLYLNIFNPDYPKLCVLGMVEATGLGWQGRYEQAELIGSYFSARDRKSKSAQKFDRKLQGKFPDTSAGYGYMDTPGMAFYVNKNKYKRLVKRATKKLMR